MTSRLAEAANGDLTQAQARGLVNLLRKAEGWVSAPAEATGRPRVHAKEWVMDPLMAEAKLDESARARMGPFLPLDPAAISAALGAQE